jgi:glutamate synthase (NADPH/NADH) large chain
MGGYPLPHAMMMLIPGSLGRQPADGCRPARLLRIPRSLMEPWDGPAAIAFTDGRQIGATLDRNGLRPARYLVTDDGSSSWASEMGVLEFDEKSIVKKWRLQPGKMLLIDLEAGPHHRRGPQGRACHQVSVPRVAGPDPDLLKDELPRCPSHGSTDRRRAARPQQAFGYTQEDLKFLLAPMALTGQEAIGSMGADTPVSVLSSQRQAAVTPTSSRTSPRSPTRRSTRSARNWSCRWCRSSARARTCLT